MSQFFDLASMVLVPSGYRDGKLYSQKPLSSSGELTFSRGSDIEATRVASNGYIEKAKVNLLLQSNSYLTSWTVSNAVLYSGQVGYDGSNDAWLLENTDADGYITQSATLSAVQTYSVYAKAGTLDFIRIRVNVTGTNVDAYFDLSTGTYAGTTVGTAIDATITSMGSGWYRCTLTCNESTTSVRFYPAIAYDDLTATSGNIYIQDAQLNYGLVAQEYQETQATSVVSGITNDLPRLDYSGGASCPSLLLEPSRQNLVTQSEFFGDSSWLKTDFGTGAGAPTITANAAVSPEGLQNAYQIDFPETTGAEQSVLQYSYTSVASTTYTHTIYLKADVASTLILRNAAGGETAIEVTTEWKRFETTATASSTTSNVKFGLRPANGSQTAACTIYAWGAQAEEGSYPTSIIPTYGTSATRTADDMDTTFASPFATDGSATIFFHELGVPDSDDISSTTGDYRYQKDGDNYVSLTTGASTWRVRIQSGGSSNFETLSFAYEKTDPIKIAVVVTSITYSIYANGSAVVENESLSATADFSSIDEFNTNILEKTGVRKAVKHLVFPTALTDSEAIALTSL